MADSVVQAPIVPYDDDAANSRVSRWLFAILAVLAAACVAIIWRWNDLVVVLNASKIEPINLAFEVALSVLLAAVPVVICFVQNVAQRRQVRKLDDLAGLAVADTVFFMTARRSIESIRLRVDADYFLPILLLSVVTFLGFLTTLVGMGLTDAFEERAALLGGLHADDDLGAYQLGTFAVVGIAFLGAYVYMLGRLLDRINNNDLYPISLHYYTARYFVAVAAAAIFRHAADVLGDGANEKGGAMLVLIAFIIGFAPDLFIVSMMRRAFQWLKIWGNRDDPATNRPTSLPLLMIDDLTRDKIDRLNELGIDSAQILARQNPFLLMPRMPFDLGLLLDWIGQAQLYVWVRDDAMTKLRGTYIRNIVDFYIRLKDETARPVMCKLIGIQEAEAKALLTQIETDSAFVRLQEVVIALGKKKTDPATSQSATTQSTAPQVTATTVAVTTH